MAPLNNFPVRGGRQKGNWRAIKTEIIQPLLRKQKKIDYSEKGLYEQKNCTFIVPFNNVFSCAWLWHMVRPWWFEDFLPSINQSSSICQRFLLSHLQMLEDDGRHGVTGWMSSWLGGRGAQSVPNTPQRPTSGQGLNSVRNTAWSERHRFCFIQRNTEECTRHQQQGTRHGISITFP